MDELDIHICIQWNLIRKFVDKMKEAEKERKKEKINSHSIFSSHRAQFFHTKTKTEMDKNDFFEIELLNEKRFISCVT